MCNWFKVILVISLQVTPAISYAQQGQPVEATAPSTAQWQKWESDKAINYKDRVEYDAIQKKKELEKDKESANQLQMLQNIFNFLSSTTGKVIMGSILLLIAGFVVYKILAGKNLFRKAGAKVKNETAPQSDTTDDLHANDWERKMAAAYAEGDSRLAIRYGYLRVLQLLQEGNLINYRQDLPNIHYLRELKEAAVKDTFQQMSREYEWAWYGNYAVSPAAYAQYLNLLQTAKTKIG